MKKMVYVSLFVVLTVAVAACRKGGSRTVSVVSPSGKYSVFATVNRSKSDKTKYLCVKLHLQDANGRELSVLQTSASITMKWALGWMKKKDVVVLYSSDIGTYAYAVKEGKHLTKIITDDQIIRRGDELKSEKYK